MKSSILQPKQEEWLARVREQSERLLAALARFHAPDEDQKTVKELLRRLDEIFILVVVGEFNSGKSAFINALVGTPVLEEGVLPTTSSIQFLKFGEPSGPVAGSDGTITVSAPLGLLENVRIVDTPGTNAIDRRHEAIANDFIPRADLVLFVTSAERPFTESERAFLARIRDWGKKIVFIVNKMDILETGEDRKRVESFVREHAKALIGMTPELFSVSAREAMRAKKEKDDARLETSGLAWLERYIRETLDEKGRVRLKLLTPLGAGHHLLERHLAEVERQSKVLRQDLETVDAIDKHLSVYKTDMSSDFRYRLADVDNVLHQMTVRGHEFIEDFVRVPRLIDLMNKDKVKSEFEKKVVADAPAQIERRVQEIIDWLISSDLQQWQFVKDQIARRRSDRSKEAVGEVPASFDYDRNRLVESVGKAAQRTLESYDRVAEAHRMAESVQSAVAGTALLEVGAVGLGTAVTLVATTTAADVTGLLAAGVLATIGFLVIPNKRRTAKKELHEKVEALRQQLMAALTEQFDREVERSFQRLNGSITSYTRFVKAEEKTIGEKEAEFTAIRTSMSDLRTEIESS